jgi:phosphoribosylanthranilate isomerase
MPTRIKICGITRLDDALAACRAGADALGFVFYPPSPRHIEPAAARSIVDALPPFVTTVGLFVDAEAAFVAQVLDEARLDLLQFHGEETPSFCASFARPYIKAVRMRPGADLLEYARRFSHARGLLLDAFVSGSHGGTGTRFDWSLIPAGVSLPIVLSGGLDPDNAGEAIARVRPWAVDVSSGVEALGGQKGVKDPRRVQEFISRVRDADA